MMTKERFGDLTRAWRERENYLMGLLKASQEHNVRLSKLVSKLAKLQRDPSRFSHMHRGNEYGTGERWPDKKVAKLVAKATKIMQE